MVGALLIHVTGLHIYVEYFQELISICAGDSLVKDVSRQLNDSTQILLVTHFCAYAG
jgi:hypothetical protein